MAASGTRHLFGGAIETTLPKDLIDASDLRQVPDTQEVFLYPNPNISVVVEILQVVEPSDPVDYAKFHFDSLAHDNNSEKNEVLQVKPLSQDQCRQNPAPVVLSGTQSVTKFNSADADDIRVLLAVYRIAAHNIDLVMSMNVPSRTHDGGAVDEAEWERAQEVFVTAAQSLQVIDYGLFA